MKSPDFYHLPPPEKILVFGARGQLGSFFVSLLGDSVLAVDKQQVDLSQSETISQFLDSMAPRLIINASGYTNVDKAESEPDLCNLINLASVIEMVKWCQKNKTPILHFSTDYVFDGRKQGLYLETDQTNPVNIYGKSKAMSELVFTKLETPWLVFRTSWLYSGRGNNFALTILRLARDKDEIKVVCDQIGAPTYAKDLAEISLRALDFSLGERVFPSGIYHLCSRGETSWHGFAKFLLKNAKNKNNGPFKMKALKKILTPEYFTPAKRPLNSRLNLSKFQSQFEIELPNWEEGAMRFLDQNHLLSEKPVQ